jgi:hypothetical protein
MSTSEENKQFVLTAYRTFVTRDKDKIASYFAPGGDTAENRLEWDEIRLVAARWAAFSRAPDAAR